MTDPNPTPEAEDARTMLRGISGILDSIPNTGCARDAWATITTSDGTDRAALQEIGALLRREHFATFAQANGLRLSANDIDAITCAAGLALSFAAARITDATEIIIRDHARGRLPKLVADAITDTAKMIAGVDENWGALIKDAAATSARNAPPSLDPEATYGASLTAAEITAGRALLTQLAMTPSCPVSIATTCIVDGMIHIAARDIATPPEEEEGNDARPE